MTRPEDMASAERAMRPTRPPGCLLVLLGVVVAVVLLVGGIVGVYVLRGGAWPWR